VKKQHPVVGDGARASVQSAVLAAEGRDPQPSTGCDRNEIECLDPDWVRVELERVLMSEHPQLGLQMLYDAGVLDAFLPEVAALVGFGEGAQRHKDVWDHTKRVVAQSPRCVEIRWAALLHDVGKIRTRKVAPDGQIQFHGHAEVGARMSRRVFKRLRFDRAQAKRIRELVLFHQRPSQYEPSWTDAAVRRFGREVEDLFDDLLDLSRADMTTKYESKRKRGHELIDELARRREEIRELDARVPLLPKGLGLGIIQRFHITPGPRVGQLRDAVEDAVERGELEPQQEEEVYLEWLSEHIDEI